MLPPIRKSLTQKLKEEELDDLGRVENVKMDISVRKQREEVCKRLTSAEKQSLNDYIFGKTAVNPIEVKMKGEKDASKKD